MARLIDFVVGHDTLKDRFDQLIESNKWPSSLMLVGPSGIGKKKLILSYIQKRFCTSEKPACGHCGSCLRVAKGQHENLILVKPSADSAVPQIKVDEIRDVLDRLSLASDGIRFVVIDDAHKMNSQASNALLKSLEEPSENVFFILIGDDPDSFLSTIKSRCQIFRAAALSEDHLRQIRPLKPDWIYKSARGRLDRFDSLISEEGLEKREEALSLFEFFCVDSQFLYEKTWRDLLKDKSKAQFVIIQWTQMARDVMMIKAGRADEVLNLDQLDRLKMIAEHSSSKWSKLSQNLIAAEKSLLGHQDPVLLFENLWVNYAKMD